MRLGLYGRWYCMVNTSPDELRTERRATMDDLADGVAQFQRDVFSRKADLFAHLATTHTPSTLFIGCSDARVVPELITSSEPGELFVIRTAGNLVPAYRQGADGVAASVEYAVAVLGVRRIVVCGHSACGAMTALAEGHDLTAAPAVADWLRHAAAARAHACNGDVAQLVQCDCAACESGDPSGGRPESGRSDPNVARLGVRHCNRHRRRTPYRKRPSARRLIVGISAVIDGRINPETSTRAASFVTPG
jgi:carbonic anhydrase